MSARCVKFDATYFSISKRSKSAIFWLYGERHTGSAKNSNLVPKNDTTEDDFGGISNMRDYHLINKIKKSKICKKYYLLSKSWLRGEDLNP